MPSGKGRRPFNSDVGDGQTVLAELHWTYANVSDSLEKPSFLSRLLIGLPHLTSTTSTPYPLPFFFHLLVFGLRSTSAQSERSIGDSNVFLRETLGLQVSSALTRSVLLPLLLLETSDELFLRTVFRGVPHDTETGQPWRLRRGVVAACGATLIESSSLVMSEPMVPVVPTLIVPPSPWTSSVARGMICFVSQKIVTFSFSYK